MLETQRKQFRSRVKGIVGKFCKKVEVYIYYYIYVLLFVNLDLIQVTFP